MFIIQHVVSSNLTIPQDFRQSGFQVSGGRFWQIEDKEKCGSLEWFAHRLNE